MVTVRTAISCLAMLQFLVTQGQLLDLNTNGPGLPRDLRRVFHRGMAEFNGDNLRSTSCRDTGAARSGLRGLGFGPETGRSFGSLSAAFRPPERRTAARPSGRPRR